MNSNTTNTKQITEITKPLANGQTAKWSYISLIFSLFYFFPLMFNFDNISLSKVSVIVIIYITFLVLFFSTAKHVGKQAITPIVLMILTAALGASINSGTNALFGYAAYFSSYYFRRNTAILFFVGNLSAQLVAAISFDLFHVYFLGPAMAVTASLFIYGIFSRKDVLHNLNVQKQDEQIEQLAAIAERERIARDMHDLLGHSLSSLALKSELAEKWLEKQNIEKAKSEIHEVAVIARQTLSEVREAVTGLKKQSLINGISQITKQLEQLGFTTATTMSLKTLDSKIESVTYMVCKEWATNIMRHSKGDLVTLTLNQSDTNLSLSIHDNGHVKAIKPGNGVEGIKSRITEVGGTTNISINDGVTLVINIPLKRT